MKTLLTMRRLFLGLILLYCLSPGVWADVYVSPEEHRAMAKEGLEAQLASVPKEEQVEFVQALLDKIPLDILELQVEIEEAKKSKTGTPAYFLAKGFDTIEYRAQIYREWLSEHGAQPREPDKSGTPKATASPAKQEGHRASPLSDRPMLSSTHLVALAFLAGGLLLGLRRALKPS